TRGSHGAIDVARATERHLGPGRARRGIDALDDVTVCRLDPVAADVQTIVPLQCSVFSGHGQCLLRSEPIAPVNRMSVRRACRPLSRGSLCTSKYGTVGAARTGGR